MAKWIAGQSGNPMGRPRSGVSAADLARKQIDRHKLFEKLGELAARVNEKGADPRIVTAAMRAAEILMDRGFGKPPQEIHQSKTELQIRVIYADIEQRSSLDVAPASPGAIAGSGRSPAIQCVAGGEKVREIDAGAPHSDT